MLPEENDSFEIPSFVEAKDEVVRPSYRHEDMQKSTAGTGTEYRHRHAANNISSHLAESAPEPEPEEEEPQEEEITEEEPVVKQEPVKEPVRETKRSTAAETKKTVKKRRRKVSPLVMVLALVALIMALVAVVLGTISLFNHSAPSPTPMVTPTATPVATPTATPETTATTDPSATSDASAAGDTTPTPETESETVIARYRLLGTMNIRTGPSTDYSKIDPSAIPAKYADSTDGSMMLEGTVIDVYEISEDGGVIFGRIGNNAWICLEDNSGEYAELQ